jgi:hypothetical protein
MNHLLKFKNQLILSVLILSFYANAQINLHNSDISTLNDGPYIFIEENDLIEKKIIKGEVIKKKLPLDSFDTIYPTVKAHYENIKDLVVLSDIHGQYDLAVELFKNNNIIDDELNWSFGKGHLVIIGDVFDRGPKVNEVLWLIYKLEKQAKLSKGRVHLLLGNHEYMVLRDDLRYINDKYKQVSELFKISYSGLYGNQTILGRWLRSKATIMKINQHTFVHGGISKSFSLTDYDMENTNKAMRESIDIKQEELKSTGFYNKHYGTNGPIWYRGLILGNLSSDEVTSILEKINSEHIVVGHCSDDKIVQLHDQKVFGVDSSIKKGHYGELLFIENGSTYYRGTLDGKKIKLKK